jgi:hypothetical protein
MKKIIKFFAIATVMVAFSAATYAQNADANAVATIISPMTITWVADLDFGNIVGTAAGGTVTVATDGTRGGTPALIVNNLVAAAPAQFTVGGSVGSDFSITITGATLTDAAGANPMTVGTFVSDPDGTGTIAAASFTLSVGATLTVPASQPAGAYSTANTGGVPINVAVNYE